ncbi:MAG TPA: dTMP kinase [Planctomycetota bacterium]|nr:dTMP kinase [Planctomycetota bacterium]
MSVYVVVDGPDGCGKSSQAAALCAWLGECSRPVLHVREPGSTPVGEALRQLLLSPTTGELAAVTEALLFSAARAELVTNVIAPALQRGTVVVAERCYLSTIVYQSFAAEKSLDLDWLLDLTRRVHGASLPDAIFVLDVPAAVGRARRRARADDRIEARGAAYHERVRNGYLQAARLEVRAHVLDAARPFAAVQQELRDRVAKLLP